MVSIWILIAVTFFLAGELYRDEEFRPIGGEQWVEDGELRTRHLLYFETPLKTATATKWLDWMIRDHNYYIVIRKKTYIGNVCEFIYPHMDRIVAILQCEK